MNSYSESHIPLIRLIAATYVASIVSFGVDVWKWSQWLRPLQVHGELHRLDLAVWGRAHLWTSSSTSLPPSSYSRRAVWRIWTQLQWTATLRWVLRTMASHRMRSAWDSPESCKRTASGAGGNTGVGGGVGVVDVVTSSRCMVNGYLSIARILKLWCWVSNGVWVLSITGCCFGRHILLVFGK